MIFLVFKSVIFYENSLLGTALKITAFVRVEKQKQFDGTFLCAPGGRFFLYLKQIYV